MSSAPDVSRLRRLARAARAAGRRQKLNLALQRLAWLLPFPLAYGALALAAVRWWQPSAGVVRGVAYGFAAALLVPIVGVIAAVWKRRPESAGALALDRHHGSADRITNALAFSELPAAERSPFMEAAIVDALAAVEKPSPARAVPLAAPRRAWVSVALALCVLMASRLQRPAPEAAVLPPALAPIDPVALTADDVSLLRESAEVFAASASSPELAEAVSRFNQLVEDIAERRVDRRELFTRLMEIERSLSGSNEDDAALDASLEDLARELSKSPLSRPVAEAFEQRRLPDAERALRELAEKLREERKVDRAELERLRKALEAAAEQATGRVQRLEAARRNLESERRRLLQKKGDKSQAPAEEAELDRQRRQLERLNRDIEQAKRAKEELSALDRELAQAARDLMRELGESAKHLESGAEDINRMARKKMSEQEKQELKRQLEELRELLRQSGPGKEEHLRRLQRFAERARGQKGGGQQGEGNPGQQGSGTKPGQRLTLGPGGQPLPVPVPGGGKSGGQGRSEPGSSGGSGEEAGSASGPDIKGAPSDLEGKTEDVTAAAIDTGQGTASSEVVFSASERGFSGSRYQKVYTQYRTVAEDVLEQDTIPAGYEFYVRRYFQLIRPRDAE